MIDPLLFAFWPEAAWCIPAVGLAVACAAFVWGRRLVLPPTQSAPEAPEKKADDPNQLDKSVDVFVHGSASDRRSAPRRKGNAVEVILSRGQGQSPVHGWVVDRSVGGLCLMLSEPVPQGATFPVRPRNAPESTPWTEVEIRGCRAVDGDWEVGCRFIRSPQYNVLLLFG
jgi:PilZ domain